MNEVDRIENGVELIFSENFISRSDMTAMSSGFTQKYSEGYPRKRHYGGQDHVYVLEQLAWIKEDIVGLVGAFSLYPGLTVLEKG